MTLIFLGTSTSTSCKTNTRHNVILQDITISFCCFQPFRGNSLCVFNYLVFIVWFSQFCFHYLVCPTLFPLFGFHTEQLAAFRLFLRSKTGTRCLDSLALPSCVTRATANVRFRKIRKHLVFLKKAGVASLAEEHLRSTTRTPVILLLLQLLLLLRLLLLRLLVLPILLLLLQVLLLYD